MDRNVFFVAAGLVVLAAALVVLFLQPRSSSSAAGPSSSLPQGMGEERTVEGPQPARERIPVHDSHAPGEELPGFASMDRPGWRIRGEVMDPDGKPLCGSTIAFQFVEGDEHFDAAGVVTTGEDGSYALSLPLPEKGRHWQVDNMVPSELVATAGLIGYFSDYNFADLGPPGGSEKTPIRLDFALEPGANARGRVMMPDGSPVDFADVCLVGRSEDSLDLVAQSNPDGTWTGRTRSSGELRFMAFKDYVGQSPCLTAVRESDETVRVPDLVLNRFGLFEGVIRNSNGRPAGGFHIEAIPESLVEASERKIDRFVNNLDGTETEDDKVPYGSTTSKAGGRFRISDLSEGRYFFRVFPGVQGPDEFLEKIPRRLFQTGDRFVELVQPFYTVKLRMKDGEGGVVARASVSYRCTWQGEGWTLLSRDTRTGCMEILAVPTTFHFEAEGQGGLRAEKVVTIQEGNHETEADLFFHPTQPGRFCFHYVGTRDHPVAQVGDPDVFLRGEYSDPFHAGPALLRQDGPGSYSIEVPEDYYRVWVKPGGEQSFFLPVALHVKIYRGKDGMARVPLRPGGRLTATLVPGLDAANRSPVDSTLLFRKNGDGDWKEYARLTGGNRAVPVHDFGRPTMPDIRCCILEAGEYRLEMKRRGWKPGKKEFRIVPGEETPVDLRLEPQ